jgi:hypothetical protein
MLKLTNASNFRNQGAVLSVVVVVLCNYTRPRRM